MTVALTQADFDRYQALINSGNLFQFYNDLSAKGYKYADLALTRKAD